MLAEATGKDVRARYRIGRLIKDVKGSEQRYGARAVKNLAAALGRDEATLYRFALVAEAWTEEDLDVLLARKTPHGEPLSFSHLVELAQIQDKNRRSEMLEFALSYGASVRELIDAIADPGAERTDNNGADPAPSIDSLLRRVASTCDAVQRKIEISERLLSQLERSTDPKSTNSIDELLSRAVSSQRAILEASTRSIERLERARQRLSVPSLPASKPAPATTPSSAPASDWSETRSARSVARKASQHTGATPLPAVHAKNATAELSDNRTPRLLAGFTSA
ncbi:hypothetical protein [Pendulispora albinea]|uniref:Transposase n=1 Tax=Pendulispora albinea TaxID=2741071 RepID=A0ABZ2LQ87_9BACT